MSRRGALLAAGRRFSGPNPLFFDDFSIGNFTKWAELQWKNRNTSAANYSGTGEYSGQVVADGDRPHVARFEVRDGDIPTFGGAERAEITAKSACNVVPGDERWITYDIKLDSGITSVDWGPVFTQMKGDPDSGSPGFELSADPNGNLYIRNGQTGLRNAVTTLNAIKGDWHRITMHAKFSSNSAVGFWHVYLDGVEVVPQTSRATMNAPDTSAYFKIGCYRSATATATAIASFDNVRFSDTAPSVI